MIRLGVRLTVRSSREALVRLLVTAAAVAVGVTLLLSVLGLYHAYRVTMNRACWECTQQAPAAQDGPGSLVWARHDDEYRGRAIVRVDIAVLTTQPPAIPGVRRLPGPGQYVASPALESLLAREPADQLADRFPGRLAGVIAPAGLSSPDDLVIVVGYSPDQLRGRAGITVVSAIDAAPRAFGSSVFYQFGFAMGTVALLVPLMVLIGTATRLAAARREERYAAMRLVGATTAQINLIASLDAVAAAFLGAAVGIGGYFLVRPGLVRLPLLGSRFFDYTITPTAAGFAAALIAVPAAAAAASLISLRRVQVSPLGVSRRATPPPPRAWRVIPLGVGVPLFVVPLLLTAGHGNPPTTLAVPALGLVLFGMSVAGPWLTGRAARVLGRHVTGGATLLGARRLADNPRAAFRSVGGLVLAVLIGTTLAAIVPVVLDSQHADASALQDVVRAGFAAGPPSCPGGCDPASLPPPSGLSAMDSDALLRQLRAMPGVDAVPIYVGPGGDVVACDDLRRLPILGSCAPGTRVVVADTWRLFVDNVSSAIASLPLAKPGATVFTGATGDLGLDTVLVTTPGDPTTLERVRTLLSRYGTAADPAFAPKTFGEVATARAALYREADRAVLILTALTLLIAGCSLAVSVTGSLVERKRPFTLLRVSGTTTAVLHRVVLLETLLPLAGAAVVAAGIGLALAYPITRTLTPARHAVALPGRDYYVILGTGMLFALTAIAACLPILTRITHPDTARFE